MMSEEASVFVGIGVVILMLTIIFALVFIFIGASLVINGIPLYRLAKNAGHSYPWLAFVPGGNTWTLVMLAKKPFDMLNGALVLRRDYAAMVIILLPVAFQYVCGMVNALAAIPIIGILFAIFSVVLSLAVIAVSMILRFYLIDDFFSTYTPNDPNKTLFVVLSLFIPLFFLIMLYIHMNDEPDYTYAEYYAKAKKTV